jgi:hypothetical protein
MVVSRSQPNRMKIVVPSLILCSMGELNKFLEYYRLTEAYVRRSTLLFSAISVPLPVSSLPSVSIHAANDLHSNS